MIKNEKAFSLLLKIIIIGALLSLVLIVIIIYSKNLDKTENKEKVEQSVNTQQIQEKRTIDYGKLRRDYKSGLIEVLNEFDGNYEKLHEQITDLVVPSGYQKIHLELVIAIDSIMYGDDEAIAKERLKEISDDNKWLADSLSKVISSIE